MKPLDSIFELTPEQDDTAGTSAPLGPQDIKDPFELQNSLLNQAAQRRLQLTDKLAVGPKDPDDEYSFGDSNKPKEQRSLYEEFGHGVVSGFKAELGMVDAAQATLQSMFGFDPSENIKEFKELNREMETGARRAVRTVEEIETIKDAALWAAGAAGEMAPFTASIIASGGVGRLGMHLLIKGGYKRTMKEAAREAALKKATAVGAGVASVGLGVGEAGGEQIETTGEVVSPGLALGTGAAVGAIDLITPLGIASKFGLTPTLTKKFAEQLTREAGLRGILKETGKIALKEGITEGLQESILMASRTVYDENYDLLGPEAKSRLLNAMAAGAVVGGIYGAPSAVLMPSGPDLRDPSSTLTEGDLVDEDFADDPELNDADSPTPVKVGEREGPAPTDPIVQPTPEPTVVEPTPEPAGEQVTPEDEETLQETSERDLDPTEKVRIGMQRDFAGRLREVAPTLDDEKVEIIADMLTRSETRAAAFDLLEKYEIPPEFYGFVHSQKPIGEDTRPPRIVREETLQESPADNLEGFLDELFEGMDLPEGLQTIPVGEPAPAPDQETESDRLQQQALEAHQLARAIDVQKSEEMPPELSARLDEWARSTTLTDRWLGTPAQIVETLKQAWKNPMAFLYGSGMRMDNAWTVHQHMRLTSYKDVANKKVSSAIGGVKAKIAAQKQRLNGYNPEVAEVVKEMDPGDIVFSMNNVEPKLRDAAQTLVRRWQREFAPDMKVVLIHRKSSEYGSVQLFEDGMIIYTDFSRMPRDSRITTQQQIANWKNGGALWTLAHEFGHGLANYRLLRAPTAVQAAVANDYRTYVEKAIADGAVVADLARERYQQVADLFYDHRMRSRSGRAQIAKEPYPETPFWLGYMLDPHEWFADQLAKELIGTKSDQILAPETNSFIKEIAKHIRDMWEHIASRMNISADRLELGKALAAYIHEKRFLHKLDQVEEQTGAQAWLVRQQEAGPPKSRAELEDDTIAQFQSMTDFEFRLLERIKPTQKARKERVRQELSAIKATKAEIQAAEIAMARLPDQEFTWESFVRELERLFIPLQKEKRKKYSMWGVDETFDLSRVASEDSFSNVLLLGRILFDQGFGGIRLESSMRDLSGYAMANESMQAQMERAFGEDLRKAVKLGLRQRQDEDGYAEGWTASELELVLGKGATADTIVFRSPYRGSSDNHFNDPNYVGHVRVVDTKERRWVMEVQSDLAQKGGRPLERQEEPDLYSPITPDELAPWAVTESRSLQSQFRILVEALEKQDPNLDDAVFRMAESMLTVERPQLGDGQTVYHDDWGAAFKGLGDVVRLLSAADTPLDRKVIAEHAKEAAAYFDGFVSDLVPLEGPNKPVMEGLAIQLPRINQRLTREVIAEAGRNGQFRVMFPTEETLVSVEEWTRSRIVYNAQQLLKTLRMGDEESALQAAKGIVLVKNDYVELIDDESSFEEHAQEILNSVKEEKPGIRKLLEALDDENNNYSAYISVMRRQAELLKWISKQYDVAPAVDGHGNTWLEVKVPKEEPAMRVRVFASAPDPGGWQNRATGMASNAARQANPRAPSRQQLGTELDRYSWYTRFGESLTQLIKKNLHVPGMVDYGEAVDQWSNMRMTWMARANERVKEWRKLGPTQAARLGAFMQELTVRFQDKHPTKEEFIKLWQDLGLSRDAKLVYDGLRDDFKAVLDSIQEALIADIYRTYTNQGKIQQEISKVRQDIDKLRKRPFFPLSRFGRHTVVVKDGKKTVRMEAFESEKEQRRRFKELMATRKGNQTVRMDYLSDEIIQFRGLPTELLRAMRNRLHLTTEQERELDELLVEHSPASSFKKHFTKRDVTPGFDKDAQRAYADYFFHGANQIARMHFSDAMLNGIRAVKESADTLAGQHGVDLTKRRKMHEWLSVHYDYLMSPENDWAGLRSAAFIWYLGLNVKSAIVNLTQVPLVTGPYLASRFGDIRAVKALTGTARGLKGSFMLNPQSLKQEELWAIERAIEEGWVDESNAAELAGLADGGLMRGKHGESVRLMQEVSAFLFHQAERANRRITLLAAYRLALQQPNNKYVQEIANANPQQLARLQINSKHKVSKEQAAAFLFAKDAVRTSQYEYARWNRPRFMRGKASVVFLFYQYLQNTLHFAANDPGKIRYMLGMVATAGLMGLPGAEDLDALVRLVSRNLLGADFSPEREARKMLAEVTDKPDLFLHGMGRYTMGLGNELTGLPIPNLDLSGSLSMGRIIPGLAEFGAAGKFEDKFLRAATDVGGAAYSIPLSILQAAYDSENPDTFKRWERAMPTALKNVSKAYRFLSEEAEFVRGDAEVVRFDPENPEHNMEIAAQALGFQPTRLSQEWDLRNAQREQAAYFALRKQGLLRAYDHARERGTPEDVKEVAARIREYNALVRAQGHTPLAITGEQISRSMKGRHRHRLLFEANVPNAKLERGLYQQVQEEYPETVRARERAAAGAGQ